MKRDGAPTTALEVVLGINTLVGVLSKLGAPKDTTSGMTVVTMGGPLPFVGITLVRALARARRSRPAFSITFFVRGLARTPVAVGGVAVRALEAARVLRRARWGAVIGVVASLATFVDFAVYEVRDLRITKDRGCLRKGGVGLDEGGNIREACALIYIPKVQRTSTIRVRERDAAIDVPASV